MIEVDYLCRQILGLPAVLFSVAVERNCKQEQRGGESVRIILYVVFGLFLLERKRAQGRGLYLIPVGAFLMEG